ncbi:hypothetical protein QKT49_gp372 [Acanthamoeba castellanii medusavirus]|uniref:Uncharacterized protein n=1 Tax=Acanthamoeba castellanii medusavirus J1 TaxID=3114988 RepID=A0A3T1CX40_9VIRU|nr:hypothetical protein QKT49_gp372 [Acanthamoeba castellanii medusavirus]BBI30391.1 hypothetical protein [Acanthamoeba castellanii medusavirus J1]
MDRIWVIRAVHFGEEMPKRKRCARVAYATAESAHRAAIAAQRTTLQIDGDVLWWSTVPGYAVKEPTQEQVDAMRGEGETLTLIRNPTYRLYVECLTLE